MTPRQAGELLSVLKLKALGIDELHERVRLSGSVWTRDQLELLLRCARGISRDDTGAFYDVTGGSGDDLGTAIVEVVRSFAGKPVAASQVRARLPERFVTTDEQVVVVARRTAGLEVFGPNLIRIAP